MKYNKNDLQTETEKTGGSIETLPEGRLADEPKQPGV